MRKGEYEKKTLLYGAIAFGIYYWWLTKKPTPPKFPPVDGGTPIKSEQSQRIKAVEMSGTTLY